MIHTKSRSPLGPRDCGARLQPGGDTAWAPWYAVHSDDQRRARLIIIGDILDNIPHETAPGQNVTLPKRQKRGGDVESHDRFRFSSEAV